MRKSRVLERSHWCRNHGQILGWVKYVINIKCKSDPSDLLLYLHKKDGIDVRFDEYVLVYFSRL